MNIVVTNETDKDIKGRYASVDYEFPVGVAVEIPSDAARHIFGFGESDKSSALGRLGWMIFSGDGDAALARLALVKFGVPGADAPQVSNDGPLVNADETAGDAASPDVASPKVTKTQRLNKGTAPIE